MVERIPVDPDNREGWLQQRLVEEREENKKLRERVAELEGNLRQLKALADELFPQPYRPTSDDIADVQT